ncbi:MAG: hypothetical protein ACKPHU_07855, partial [Planctomycetaceae bacterium]
MSTGRNAAVRSVFRMGLKPAMPAGEREKVRVETTAGRVSLYNALPNAMKGNFAVVNKVMNKKAVTNLIDTVYRNCGQKETVMFCD